MSLLVQDPATNGDVPAPVRDTTLDPLVPGDGVRLSFWRDPELSGEYYVDESGVTVFPLIGSHNMTAVPAGDLKR